MLVSGSLPPFFLTILAKCKPPNTERRTGTLSVITIIPLLPQHDPTHKHCIMSWLHQGLDATLGSRVFRNSCKTKVPGHGCASCTWKQNRILFVHLRCPRASYHLASWRTADLRDQRQTAWAHSSAAYETLEACRVEKVLNQSCRLSILPTLEGAAPAHLTVLIGKHLNLLDEELPVDCEHLPEHTCNYAPLALAATAETGREEDHRRSWSSLSRLTTAMETPLCHRKSFVDQSDHLHDRRTPEVCAVVCSTVNRKVNCQLAV